MKKLVLAMTLLLGLWPAMDAQSSQTANKVDDTKWEYLVVSFGKTIFDTPEKMMAYKSIGIPIGQEAKDLQFSLDILGRFGWELISIVGAIGGDQEIVLKRRYDKARSTNEYGMIQNGKELYLKDLQDIVERTKRLLEEQSKLEEQLKTTPTLINLDEVERIKKREEYRVFLEDIYRKRFEATEISPNSTFNLAYKGLYSKDVLINITTDLTEKFLISGNSYHGGEVSAYIGDYLKLYRFREPSIEKYTNISIKVVGFINFNGKNIEVVSKSSTWSDASGTWSESLF